VERDPVIEEYKKHVDRTLLRENLKLTVEQRLRNLMQLQKLSEELQRAGRKARWTRRCAMSGFGWRVGRP
jgi:hypothetical protein